MPEVPWPTETTRAHLREFDDEHAFLHFEGPPGYPHECIVVTRGPTTTWQGRNVWHVDLAYPIITVSPSIHYVDHFHSPNPVSFRNDESKWWEA